MAAGPLQRLIALDGDVDILLREAEEHSQGNRSFSTAAALLTRVDVDRALDLFLHGVLSDGKIQKWAEFLEMNDLVDYEPGVEEVVATALFRLATPEINGPLSKDVISELRASLCLGSAGT